MTEAPPPTLVEFTWQGELQFACRTPETSTVLDGKRAVGPSPVEAVAFGLAGCMGIDVVDILQKGRHPLVGLEGSLIGNRKSTIPKYFDKIEMHFKVFGDVPVEAVERAIALSMEKYCSVWHSLRQDIELSTSFELINKNNS